MYNKILSNVYKKEQGITSDKHLGMGGVSYLFYSKDEFFKNSVIEKIKKLLNSNDFQKNIMVIYKCNLEKYKKEVLYRIAQKGHAQVEDGELSKIEEGLQINLFEDLCKKIKCQFDDPDCYGDMARQYYKALNGSLDGFEYIESSFIEYSLFKEMYKEYINNIKKDNDIEDNVDFIVQFYRDHCIDIDISGQFSRYKLIELTENYRIYNTKEIRCLKDLRAKEYYLYLNIPKIVMDAFEKMKNEQIIKKISFKVLRIEKYVPALEDLERGNLFSFDILGVPDISKLYNPNNYDDQLYIQFNRDDLSLTFEELCSNDDTVGDYFKTQVVHMQFSKKDKCYFINHIDHEFIYYTIDEYENRRSDPKIHGRKVKTFKIDDSIIPVEYSVFGRNFIYLVLNEYFKNKELLKEYFSNVEKYCIV